LARLNFDYRAPSEKALLTERRNRCPLEPVLGRILYVIKIIYWTLANF